MAAALPQPPSDDVDAALRDALLQLFAKGDDLAALRYHVVEQQLKLPIMMGRVRNCPAPTVQQCAAEFARRASDKAFVRQVAINYPWQGCKMAASLVAILCADLDDADARRAAVAYGARSLGGLPTLRDVRSPSTSLVAVLSRAVAAAGGHGRTAPRESTCLVVNLVDCAMLKAGEMGDPRVERFMSYAHSFVLLVSPAGVSLIQAWGEHGYTLQEWLLRNPRPMGFDEAAAFAERYDRFCGFSVWDDVTNALYKELFHVDVKGHVERRQGKPVPARIKSWTRVLEVPRVTAGRVAGNARLFML